MAAQSGEDELRVLVECLKNSLSGHDRNKQKEAELVSPTATDLELELDLCFETSPDRCS